MSMLDVPVLSEKNEEKFSTVCAKKENYYY